MRPRSRKDPSRSVFAVVSDGDATPVCSAVLAQRVRAGATLGVSHKRVRNGARVRFGGRLLGERPAGASTSRATSRA